MTYFNFIYFYGWLIEWEHGSHFMLPFTLQLYFHWYFGFFFFIFFKLILWNFHSICFDPSRQLSVLLQRTERPVTQGPIAGVLRLWSLLQSWRYLMDTLSSLRRKLIVQLHSNLGILFDSPFSKPLFAQAGGQIYVL